MALGALAGAYGCALLALVGFVGTVPWVASACTGAILAAALVAALVLRAKGRMPADTAARLSELQARIRPHFLFNTLNSAIALIRADPARAEAVLEDLSDLFRHALVEPGESVTLAEEVVLARRYLDIEQVRFGDRLRVEWALDPSAGGARVPPLVLQPLVENAVKHGVEPSAAGAQVKVSTERRSGSVVIKVTNTVPGGQGLPGHGVAQDNVRDRLRLLHDVQGQFRAALKDGIYQVRMEVPI
jgi:two-component system sensor histidine kinase AlgZ